MAGQWGVIDADTRKDNYLIKSYETGEQMELVFSDEFNKEGRTFYPGDDPYWEAVDLHYWAVRRVLMVCLHSLMSSRRPGIWNGTIPQLPRPKTAHSKSPFHARTPMACDMREQ